VEFTQEFNYTLEYIKGKSNIFADALLRQYGTRAYEISAEVTRKLFSVCTRNVSEDILGKLQEGCQSY